MDKILISVNKEEFKKKYIIQIKIKNRNNKFRLVYWNLMKNNISSTIIKITQTSDLLNINKKTK